MKNLLNVFLFALCAISPLALRADEAPTEDNVPVEESRVTQDLSFSQTTHHGSNHIYTGVTYYADQLQIEDGSLWLIRPDQRSTLLDWIPGDTILITQADWWSKNYYGFEFSFYNIRTRQTVDVEASVGPLLDSFYRRYIISMEYYYDDATVMLDDGSVWILPESNRYIWERWYPGDSMIIGTNSSWSYANILINLTCSQTYFPSKCVN